MALGRLLGIGSLVAVSGCAALLGIEEGAVVGEVEAPAVSAAIRQRLRAGLVGYWRFEGDGRDSADGGFDLVPAKDSPATYDAGLIGAGWVPGLAVDDSCSNCNRFEGGAGRTERAFQPDFTISVWVKPEPSPSTDRWFEYAIFDNEQIRIFGEAFNVEPAPCRPAVFIMKNGAPVYAVRDPVFDFRSSPNQGRWNHIVAFRRGVTLGLRVNDVTTMTTQAAPGGEGAPGTFRVGGAGPRDGWQGAIDELGIWNRALEPDELEALYNQGRGVGLFP